MKSLAVAECCCLREPLSTISLSAAQFGSGVSSSGTFAVEHLFIWSTVKLCKHVQTEAQLILNEEPPQKHLRPWII